MNYSKISGQSVCKMAMLLAFVFAACSENEGPLTGGTVEETGVYALSGRVGDVYPKLLAKEGSADSSRIYDNVFFAPKGSIVTVSELDSSTLTMTGVSFVDTVDNDSGRFEFSKLSLNSPYVLIAAQERYAAEFRCSDPECLHLEDTNFAYKDALKAIVDLRARNKVSINLLSNLKVPLLLDYFAEGKTFVEANKLAERTILENHGVYEDLGPFENLNDEVTELSFVARLMVQLDWFKNYPYESVIGVNAGLVYANPKVFFGLGDELNQYYLNELKMAGYGVGYYARQNGFGRCTESRENEIHSIKSSDLLGEEKRDYAVVCRSGKWTLGFKKTDYSKGTMVDERDGKTYKTVTYNWGEVSQTWMAENLDFVDTLSVITDSALKANLSGGISCYREYDQDCRSYGHAYTWSAAMNVGKSEIEETFDTIHVEPGVGYGGITDFVIKIPASELALRQGVCPDGWRIPTWNDWKTLLQKMGALYGTEYDKVVPVLYDEFATGFGLSSYIYIDEFKWAADPSNADVVPLSFESVVGGLFHDMFVIADAPPYEIEFFNNHTEGFGFDMRQVHDFAGELREEYMKNVATRFIPYVSKGAVRCIKK